MHAQMGVGREAAREPPSIGPQKKSALSFLWHPGTELPTWSLALWFRHGGR